MPDHPAPQALAPPPGAVGPATDPPPLDARGVVVSLGRGPTRTDVLHGADLRVDAGEVVGLIGETGSGKTTLARTVLGLNRLRAGTVRVHGQDVTRLRGRALRTFRRAGTVQYVFQDPLRSLDPDRTLGDSVAEGLRARGDLTRAEVSDRVAAALDLVGLPPALAGRLPGQVSGGQRQRVAIARAMALRPRLLLCDEPVSALDASTRTQVLDLLLSLRDNGSDPSRPALGMLFISHDLGSVAGITDRVVVLYRGRVVESGPTDQVVSRPHHPYTRLLVGSAPTLAGAGMDRTERRALRALLEEEST